VSPSEFVVPYLPVGTTYGETEWEALRECLLSHRTLSCGDERDAFESEFAAAVGARHAISLANCTVALELATYLCDLREGDEVIVTCQSYQATATPLLTTPATVRFCDIDPLTLNISLEALRALLTNRTQAIFLVHYGGALAEVAPIRALARERGVVVVEDCAHSLGATGNPPGPWPEVLGCWSFQSYKNISTLGEGGMITTDDDEWAARLRRLRSIEPDADYTRRTEHLLDPLPSDGVFRHEKEAYTHDCVTLRHPGTNSTLPEPAAAVGRVQLRRLDELVDRRRRIADVLDSCLGAIPGITVQPRPTGRSAHHLYTFFTEPRAAVGAPELLGQLLRAGIEVQQRYFPIHLLPEWRRRGTGPGLCPVGERTWFERQVNLPIYPQMTDAQLGHMVDALRRLLAR